MNWKSCSWVGVLLFLMFCLVGNAQTFNVPYSTITPTIDGVLNPLEWADASSNLVTMTQTDGPATHPATLYLKHDGTWLYVGINSGWGSGWDVYCHILFDGNHNHVMDGSATEPHIDASSACTSPGGWSGYNSYWVSLSSSNAIQVLSPAGTAQASAGSNPVSYEFKVKLSDLGSAPGNVVGFSFMHGVDGVSGYAFPADTVWRRNVDKWANLNLLQSPANLVQNPSFEDGWNYWSITGGSQYWTIATDDSYTGAKCARFSVSPGYYDAGIRSDSFTLQAGVTYAIKAAIRELNTHDTGSASMTIFDIGLSDFGLGGSHWVPLPAPPPSSTWQTIQTFYTPTQNQTLAFEIQIHGYATASPAWAAVDSVSVSPVTNSPSNSTVQVSPGSVPADGKSTITATVTIRDLWNNPVAGQTVQIYAANSPAWIKITQPTQATDANGQTTATITATTPCTNFISVIAPVIVTQPARVQFTSPSLVPPDPALSNAIVKFAAEIGSVIEGDSKSLSNLAIDEGLLGDYFQAQAGAEQAKAVVDFLFFGAGQAADGVVSKLSVLKQTLAAFGETVANTITDQGVQDTFDSLSKDHSGLSKAGQNVATGAVKDLAYLQYFQGLLLVGVSPGTNMTADFTNDLQLRAEANQIWWNSLQQEDNLLRNLQVTNTGDALVSFLFEGGVALAAVFAPPPLDFAIAVADFANTENQHQQAIDSNKASYALALSYLMNCSEYEREIFRNGLNAYDNILFGRKPEPLTGQMLSTQSIQQGTNQLGKGYWFYPDTDSSTYDVLLFTPSNTYSVVVLTNTSQRTASYVIFASLSYVTNWPFIGTNAPSILGIVKTNLMAGQFAQVTMQHFNFIQPTNCSSQVQLSVIAGDSTGTYFIGSSNIWVSRDTNSSAQQLSFGPTHLEVKPLGSSSPSGSGLSNTIVIPNPIRCYIIQNPTNQTYQSTIRVANPFAIPLLVTITQPLPDGITVLTTDGMLGSSSIVWTNIIATNASLQKTFTFTLPVLPGVSTNLPPPNVIFTDTYSNSLSFQSVAANFNGLFPVQVSASVPTTVLGTDAPMQVTVTNWTGTDQTGSLTIALADSTGAPVTNFTQSFFVNGSGSTVIAFTMPGMLPPGQYSLTGSLSVGGGTGQVMAGVYTVQLPPVMLGTASSQLWTTNGLNLFLQGAVGSNYLIEASTDLINWSPILYFSTTNSPFSFTDPSATNSSMQFYRAVMP
jgi:hypothetical protein